MTIMCLISAITSLSLPLHVLSACSTKWCTCMRSRIRILKTFSSEIKSHRRFYLSTRSCYGISVFYNLLWFCFIIVTVWVTFEFIHLERFKLSVAMRTGGIFSSLTKVTTVHSDDVDRSTDPLETEAAELFALLSGKESKARSMFQFLPSRTQLVSLRTQTQIPASAEDKRQPAGNTSAFEG